MKETLVRLRFLLPSLPKSEKKVADYLLENHEMISSMTLAILAQETGSSEASIVRFCRKMNFDGFTSMKQAFMSEMVDTSETISENIEKSDSIETILKKVINDNINTLTDTLALTSDDWDMALEALREAKSIHFFGTGDAHAVCQLASIKFRRLGIYSTAESDVTMQLIVAGSLGPKDVAVAVTYSGSTRTTTQALKVAKDAHATTLCITRVNKSPILKYTDYKLFIATTDLTVSRELLSRRIADQAILDALYLGVLTKSDGAFDDSLRKTQKAIDHDKL